MEENKNPLRTLAIVQVVTIIILILLLIQQVLPFFGLAPIGSPKPQFFSSPGGGYVSPSNQQTGRIDRNELALALSPSIVLHQ